MKWLCGNCFLEMKQRGRCLDCGFDNEVNRKETKSLEMGALLAGRYVIGRVLGVGGFSITYKAYDTVLRNIVAIKEYLPNEFSTRVPTQKKVTIYSGDKEEQFHAGRKKFVDEAKKLAKFSHRDEIVRIYDCFDENNTSYIVMEYIDARTLDQIVRERNKIGVEEAVNITISILDALDEVHKTGILHRDIAPDNILLTEDGRVKVIDFGAARYATTTHSKSLSVIIKPGYAPIEQYRSKGDQGPWTDIYGVAATLYKMITGITPEDSMERSVKDVLKKPSRLGIPIDKHTENALMNALNVPIEGRPASAEEFKQQLLSKKVRRKYVKTKKEVSWKVPSAIKAAGVLLVGGVCILLILIQNGRFDVPVKTFKSYIVDDNKTRVPNVVNTDLEQAQEDIEAQTLNFVIVDKEYSSEIPKDKVLVQNVEAGSIVDKGIRVGVTVSGGEEQEKEETLAEDETRIPDTQYKSEAEAIKMLEAAGLAVKTEYEESDTVEDGLVIRQNQQADLIVKKGITVVITVSRENTAENDSVQQQNPTPANNENVVNPQDTAPVTPLPAQESTPPPAPEQPVPNDDGWQTDFDLEW